MSNLFEVSGISLDAAISILYGVIAPGGTPDTDTAPVGSVYYTTSGITYKKMTEGDGADKWTSESGGDLGIKQYRNVPSAAPQILDSLTSDNAETAVWAINIRKTATPADRETIIITGSHNGTVAHHNVYSRLKFGAKLDGLTYGVQLANGNLEVFASANHILDIDCYRLTAISRSTVAIGGGTGGVDTVALTAETSARTASDATLQASIATETAARIAADTALQTAITAEESARIAAIDAVTTLVNSKADITAVATQFANIQTSIVALQTNVTTIQGDITTINTSITTINDTITGSQTAVTTLQTDSLTLRTDVDTLIANPYVLPAATETTLGGIMVGSGLGVTPTGVLNVTRDSVTTVAGRTGNVTLTPDDIVGLGLVAKTNDYNSLDNKPNLGPGLSSIGGTISIDPVLLTPAQETTPPAAYTLVGDPLLGYVKFLSYTADNSGGTTVSAEGIASFSPPPPALGVNSFNTGFGNGVFGDTGSVEIGLQGADGGIHNVPFKDRTTDFCVECWVKLKEYSTSALICTYDTYTMEVAPGFVNQGYTFPATYTHYLQYSPIVVNLTSTGYLQLIPYEITRQTSVDSYYPADSGVTANTPVLPMYIPTSSTILGGGGQQLTLNTWHHVALVRGLNKFKVFLNGVLQMEMPDITYDNRKITITAIDAPSYGQDYPLRAKLTLGGMNALQYIDIPRISFNQSSVIRAQTDIDSQNVLIPLDSALSLQNEVTAHLADFFVTPEKGSPVAINSFQTLIDKEYFDLEVAPYTTIETPLAFTLAEGEFFIPNIGSSVGDRFELSNLDRYKMPVANYDYLSHYTRVSFNDITFSNQIALMIRFLGVAADSYLERKLTLSAQTLHTAATETTPALYLFSFSHDYYDQGEHVRLTRNYLTPLASFPLSNLGTRGGAYSNFGYTKDNLGGAIRYAKDYNGIYEVVRIVFSDTTNHEYRRGSVLVKVAELENPEPFVNNTPIYCDYKYRQHTPATTTVPVIQAESVTIEDYSRTAPADVALYSNPNETFKLRIHFPSNTLPELPFNWHYSLSYYDVIANVTRVNSNSGATTNSWAYNQTYGQIWLFNTSAGDLLDREAILAKYVEILNNWHTSDLANIHTIRGEISTIRVTSGVPRYLDNFTPLNHKFSNSYESSIAYLPSALPSSLLTFPIASATVVGGVKIGNNVNVTGDGTISVTLPAPIPQATDSIYGIVKPGSGLQIINGVLGLSPTYLTPVDLQTVTESLSQGDSLANKVTVLLHFEESAGSVIFKTDGTLSNNPIIYSVNAFTTANVGVFNTPELPSGALEFGLGNASGILYIKPHGTTTPVPKDTSDFCIEGWFNPTAVTSDTSIISIHNEAFVSLPNHPYFADRAAREALQAAYANGSFHETAVEASIGLYNPISPLEVILTSTGALKLRLNKAVPLAETGLLYVDNYTIGQLAYQADYTTLNLKYSPVLLVEETSVTNGLIPTGQWSHVAIVRALDTVTVYVNGVEVVSVADNDGAGFKYSLTSSDVISINDTRTIQGTPIVIVGSNPLVQPVNFTPLANSWNASLWIGADTTSENATLPTYTISHNTIEYTNAYKGLVDEVRITSGVPRYLANFATPTAKFSESQADVVNYLPTMLPPDLLKLPIATSISLGGVKVGQGLGINDTGTLYTPQADFNKLGGLVLGSGLVLNPHTGKVDVSVGSMGALTQSMFNDSIIVDAQSVGQLNTFYVENYAFKSLRVGTSVISSVWDAQTQHFSPALDIATSEVGGNINLKPRGSVVLFPTYSGTRTDIPSIADITFATHGIFFNNKSIHSPATYSSIGMVKIGSGLSIDNAGVLSIPQMATLGNVANTVDTYTFETLGTVAVAQGTELWYPYITAELAEAYFTLDVPAGEVVTVQLKIEGVNIGIPITCVAGDHKSITIPLTDTITPSEALTASVTTGSSGSNLRVTVVYTVSSNLPLATATTTGIVKPGDGLEVDATGALKLRFDSSSALWMTGAGLSLQVATPTTTGVIQVGSGLTIDNNGVLSANAGSYTLPKATTVGLGGIQVGTGLAVDVNGVLSVTGGGGGGTYILPKATSNDLGGIRIGTGLVIDVDGIVSATGGGGGSTAVAYDGTFTDANLVAGVFTCTHSLGIKYITVQVYDDADFVVIPSGIKALSTSEVLIDLTQFAPITGTWKIRCV